MIKTVEQKAKAYDKVREKIAIRFGSNVADEIFSEYEESEDERIRKWIIENIQETLDVNGFLEGQEKNARKAIAWLEKQGEQASDKIVEKARTEKQRVLLTETDGNANKDWDTRSLQDVKLLLEYGLNYIKKLESQGEHQHFNDNFPSFDEAQGTVIVEKQGKQEQLYIRFGEIPTDEKSKIYRGEIEVGIENGVSVYPAFKTNEGDIVLGLNLPVTKTTLYTQQHLIEYDNRPCYLVKGDYVGKDTDGQPLINNVSIIEKIGNYRIKEEKQREQKPYGQRQECVDCQFNYAGECKGLCAMKRGEQKPVDNVEPKFKVE